MSSSLRKKKQPLYKYCPFIKSVLAHTRYIQYTLLVCKVFLWSQHLDENTMYMIFNFSALNASYKSACIYRSEVKPLNVKAILIEVKVRSIKHLHVNDIIFFFVIINHFRTKTIWDLLSLLLNTLPNIFSYYRQQMLDAINFSHLGIIALGCAFKVTSVKQ